MTTASEHFLRPAVQARLPTRHGEFVARVYEDPVRDGAHHLALIHGDLDAATPGEEPLVRLHSECLTGDALGSVRCDCGPQLNHALGAIAESPRGVLVYLRQEGRGIGLYNKMRAYALQDQGLDTVEANEHLGFGDDLRDYEIAVWILRDLGIERLRLMTNNPRKLAALEEHGISVVARVPIQLPATADNQRYLQTKRSKLGHLLSDD